MKIDLNPTVLSLLLYYSSFPPVDFKPSFHRLVIMFLQIVNINTRPMCAIYWMLLSKASHSAMTLYVQRFIVGMVLKIKMFSEPQHILPYQIALHFTFSE